MIDMKKVCNRVFNYFKKNPYVSASLIVSAVLILSIVSFFFITDKEVITNIIKPSDKYYEISFQYNNGQETVIQKVKEGDKVMQPEDPFYEDYDFAGWYKDEQLYDFNEKVTSDFILMARYSFKGELIEIPEEYLNNDESENNTSSDSNNDDNKLNSNEEKKEDSSSLNKEENPDESKKEENSNAGNKEENSSSSNESGNTNKPGGSSNSGGSNNSGGMEGSEVPEELAHECLRSGNKCIVSEIYEGIEVQINGNKFFVISDTSTTYSLILSKNIAKTAWNSADDAVAIWNSSARLPSANEITNICEYNSKCPCWLYDNLSGAYNSCSTFTYVADQPGYWLNDAGTLNTQAKLMYNTGRIEETAVTELYGIRPVITLSKK